MNNKDEKTPCWQVFRKAAYLRTRFVILPNCQLWLRGGSGENPILEKESMLAPLTTPSVWKKLQTKDPKTLLDEIDPLSIPRRIKFFEAALICFGWKWLAGNGKTYGDTPDSKNTSEANRPKELLDWLSEAKFLEEVFEVYYKANSSWSGDSTGKDELRKSIFSYSGDVGGVENIKVAEIVVPEQQTGKSKLRVATVNLLVDGKKSLDSLEGKRSHIDDDKNYRRLLDELKRIPDLDLFAIPEVGLPIGFLHMFCEWSAYESRAFVAGIEHVEQNHRAFNFVLTCLPIEINGERDSVPIFRLKNHYAHFEEGFINDRHFVVPKPNPFRYTLFRWRGAYFSSYNCFELADLFHRSRMFGMLDFIVAVEWNKDMTYYNAIAESLSRDLHVFFIQSNTSLYGDSRILQPTNEACRDLARVKGGTTLDYPFTFAVADLKIAELREFQKLTFVGQEKLRAPNCSFKPTPPGYPFRYAYQRIRLGSFVERGKSDPKSIANEEEE